MTALLTMEDVAARIGLSYDRFRKVWPALNVDQGFPAPVYGRKWPKAAVDAWISSRTKRVVTLSTRRAPAPAPAGAALDPAGLGRAARAQLAQLRAR